MLFKKKDKSLTDPAPVSAEALKGRPIGLVLTKMGEVNKAQVLEALNLQKSRGGMLGEILVQSGHTTPEAVSAALAAQLGEAS